MKKLTAIILAFVLILSLTACEKASDDRIVGKVSEDAIYMWELNFFLDSVKAELINQAQLNSEEEIEDFWKNTEIDGTPAKEVAKNKAFEQATLFKQKVVLAKESGATLTEEMNSEIKTQISETQKSMGGKDAFKQALSEIGMIEDNYKTMLENYYLVDTYYKSLVDNNTLTVDDAQIAEYYEKNKSDFRNKVTAKHILFSTVDTATQEPKSEEEQKKAEETAKDIYAKITSGELDFDKAMNEYSEDPGLATNPDGYTFGRNEMVKPFEEASFNASVGEIVAPVKSDFGWHIIYVTDAVDTPLEEASESIKSTLLSEAFDKYTSEKAKNLKVERINDMIDKVKF